MYQLLSIISRLINFYEILIIIWCLLSWFPIQAGSVMYDLAAAIDSVVSPYMRLFQRFIPPIGNIDISPIVAIAALGVIQRLLYQLVYVLV